MRVAAIDCGTNSVRLLIADKTVRGYDEVDRRLHLTRLGQGVDATGEFHPDALARTFAVIDEYADAIRAVGDVERVRMVATSAARDAGNREEFFVGIEQRLGVHPEIISGDEEARLSFRGAKAGISPVTDPTLVIDIGGGSSELVVGKSSEVVSAISLDMGSVRLRERFLHGNPPRSAEVAAATEFVDGLLDDSGVDFAGIRTWIGVAGTVTTLSGAIQRLPQYDRAKVHRSRLTRAQLADIAKDLLSRTVADTMVAYPSIPQKRAEVICGGALIVARIAARLDLDMVVSETDILDGIAMGLLD